MKVKSVSILEGCSWGVCGFVRVFLNNFLVVLLGEENFYIFGDEKVLFYKFSICLIFFGM